MGVGLRNLLRFPVFVQSPYLGFRACSSILGNPFEWQAAFCVLLLDSQHVAASYL